MDKNLSYYSILHVQPDAPPEIIEASYHALQKSVREHPDALSISRLLEEAFTVLSDQNRREVYDQERTGRTGSGSGNGKGASPTYRSYCAFCQSPGMDTTQVNPDQRCPKCDSPLGFAFKANDTLAYQRSMERVQKEGEIAYYMGWPAPGQAGRIRNLSPNGIRFSGNRAPAEGQVIKVDSPLFRATGRIIYCQVDTDPGFLYAIGMEFITVVFTNVQGTFTSTMA